MKNACPLVLIKTLRFILRNFLQKVPIFSPIIGPPFFWLKNGHNFPLREPFFIYYDEGETRR